MDRPVSLQNRASVVSPSFIEYAGLDTIKLTVSDDGFTRIDDQGVPVRCAMAWKDLDGFEEHLTERIVRS